MPSTENLMYGKLSRYFEICSELFENALPAMEAAACGN
jgi:hypothetical protein